MLNEWTSVRWGDENLAWVVYYPPELVDPWVEAEAEKRRFTNIQKEAYRKSFVDELRIGDATTIMLSVHAFGAAAVDLTPLADNILLITSSGARVKPIVIEKNLDTPLRGLAQGFIFFPKQQDNNFSIVVNGLIPERETVFTFDRADRASPTIATLPASGGNRQGRNDESEEVIVKIPTTKPKKPKTPEPPTPQENPDFSTNAEVFQPTQPPDSVPPQATDFDTPPSDEVPILAEPMPPAFTQPSGSILAPRQVLDIYLKAWIAGDIDRMYSLLSTESQGKISRELFEREVLGGNFRGLLKSGYKVTWLSEEKAKVTVARKVLLMRTLDSKQVNFVDEGGSARVSW